MNRSWAYFFSLFLSFAPHTASAEQHENQNILTPHLYLSPLIGLSLNLYSDAREMRHADFQIGVTILETKGLLFGKIAYVHVAEQNDYADEAERNHALVFSPILIKMCQWRHDGSSTRTTSLVFDLGIDHRGRLISAFGLAF